MLSTSGMHEDRLRWPAVSARTADDYRQEMILWAEPVIADCIAEAYATVAIGGAYRSLLATHHRRLWRALILQHTAQIAAVRGDLLRDAVRAGLLPDALDDVDHGVLEELMDIVLVRFRGSRERVKGFGLVLLGAAANLGLGRQAA